MYWKRQHHGKRQGETDEEYRVRACEIQRKRRENPITKAEDYMRRKAREQTPEYRARRDRERVRHKARLLADPERHARLAALKVEKNSATARARNSGGHPVLAGSPCALCGGMGGEGFATRLVRDHDHVTGQLRDNLCGICNRRLGQFENNLGWLESALDYLNKWGG